MLLTETASDLLLRNFLDLPPAGHVLLAKLLRRLVHLVSDGLFLVPTDPFQSFQLRTHLRDLTLHAVKLRLFDMLAPRQQVEHFLASVADVTQQPVLIRRQIPIRTSEPRVHGWNSIKTVRTAFPHHTQNIVCADGATRQKNVASEA